MEPESAEFLKPPEFPKPTQPSGSIEFPKPPKPTKPPKSTKFPKPTELPKSTEFPKLTEFLKSLEPPKPTESLEKPNNNKKRKTNPNPRKRESRKKKKSQEIVMNIPRRVYPTGVPPVHKEFNILDLPREITEYIFFYLPLEMYMILGEVCSSWRIIMTHYPRIELEYFLANACQRSYSFFQYVLSYLSRYPRTHNFFERNGYDYLKLTVSSGNLESTRYLLMIIPPKKIDYLELARLSLMNFSLEIFNRIMFSNKRNLLLLESLLKEFIIAQFNLRNTELFLNYLLKKKHIIHNIIFLGLIENLVYLIKNYNFEKATILHAYLKTHRASNLEMINSKILKEIYTFKKTANWAYNNIPNLEELLHQLYPTKPKLIQKYIDRGRMPKKTRKRKGKEKE